MKTRSYSPSRFVIPLKKGGRRVSASCGYPAYQTSGVERFCNFIGCGQCHRSCYLGFVRAEGELRFQARRRIMGLKTVLADAFRNRYGKLLREALFH